MAATHPAGAIGNNDAMILLPEQAVLIESGIAEELFGDPFSLISATDLEGFRGIERQPPRVEIDVIELNFDDDEIVFAASGALLFCPSLQVVNMAELLAARPEAAFYSVLPRDEAQLLIELLIDEEIIAPSQAQEIAYA